MTPPPTPCVLRFAVCVTLVLCLSLPAAADDRSHPLAAPGVTSLTDGSLKYTVPMQRHVVLQRGDVRAIVVDNAAIDVPELRGHRAGYNGLAVLSHRQREANLFVSQYAGLNFEHIHDGTLSVEKERFEPRRFPMELRVIDEHTVELYQRPTGNWKLESCGRYRLLDDGVVEYTFECIPRADVFRNGYIGLFWASYIDEPRDPAIYFLGQKAGTDQRPRWIRAVSPRHGVEATHPPAGPLPEIAVHPEFPLTLVNHRSEHVYTDPWYYGISHDLAYVLMFRKRDRVWFAQSPTGGGATNPAWDFQWFIPDYKVGEAYGFVMRAAYAPFVGRGEIDQSTRGHRAALNPE